MFLPDNLPHPFAGKYVQVLSAIYGLQESNRLFALEMTRVILSAGFVQSSVEPEQFVKFAAGDSGKKCIVSVTVDDCLAVTNELAFAEDLDAALTKRFGPLTVNSVTKVHTGIEFVYYDNGAICLHQDASIARAASVIGVSHLPPVDIPAHDDFFRPLSDAEECVLVDPVFYSSIMGKLVQFLKTRHEVRQFVSFLCSRNVSPCDGHLCRAIHVLRYLVVLPGMGPVFKACGGVLHAYSDASHCLFADGCSATAYFLCFGPDNAPFLCYARSQGVKGDLAPCPMTAEYYSAGSSCGDIIHYRQLSVDLGWLVPNATILFLDNKTAIDLACAPQVSRRSRHMFVKHHWIRQLVSDGYIVLLYLSTLLMRANVLTKYLPRVPFCLQRDLLLNRSILPQSK
jgi:hypothetical protein